MKFVVFCPANAATGGPEVLHQLCFQLRNLGYNSEMFYYDYDKSHTPSPVCDCYKHYKNPYKVIYEDSPDNICIVPETYTRAFYKIKQGLRICWWLSVDNYLKVAKGIRGRVPQCNRIAGMIYILKLFLHKGYDIHCGISAHLVQSIYAEKFCLSLNIPREKIFYLSDYLNDTYLITAKSGKISEKKDQVLFNPKKGIEYTSLIIHSAPDIKWIPLINLSYEDVAKLMQESKVYIDFGNHPGKDRLPREAAVNGCCIITGRRGSAAYQQDVNIPSEFKFKDDPDSIRDIINKIREIFSSYEENTKKFEAYRQGIYNEPQKFITDLQLLVPQVIQLWQDRRKSKHIG